MASATLLPAYLLVGPDEVKRDAAIDRLVSRLEASGMATFNLDDRDMTKPQEPDEIIASLCTFPMGSDFRLVILRSCDHLVKAMSDALVSYLAAPSPDTVCLIVADALARNTRLYKAVAKIDAKAVIDCSAKKRWELPAYVQGMASRHGVSISSAAAEELVARAGESTRMLDTQLKKLAAMTGSSSIELADVERYVVRTAEIKPWDFLDAVSARDVARALELYRLLPPKSEVRLLSLLLTRVRELIVAKALDERGQARELASTLGVKDWQVKNHVRWSRLFSMDELVDALRSAVETECALKGSRDSEIAFTTWFVSIAQRSSRVS
ncbi:DNA polymerase III subunit delta [uncultured Enorma sp.]|jgi:DNA polymerase-3 subunit delta|uniref:DNA polymerase III subunit delta n=1 Tax=uncultured Enorma sp. TaxID=1714346 RepID=UPI0025D6E063|nr:DNA polymerase III subunit delta [uncultured Enorma sp.]